VVFIFRLGRFKEVNPPLADTTLYRFSGRNLLGEHPSG
jgi:hypothetical protein